MFPWAIGSARLIPFTFVYALNKHCSVAADLSRQMESGGGRGPPQRLAQPLQSPPVRTERFFFPPGAFAGPRRGGRFVPSPPRPLRNVRRRTGWVRRSEPPLRSAPQRCGDARRGARGSAAALRRSPSVCPGPAGRGALCRTSWQRAEARGKQR